MSESKIPSKVLGYHEEKALKERSRELADVRDNVEVAQGVGFETKDKGAVQKEIKRVESVLSAQSASEIDLSPSEKSQVEKEEAMLKAELQKDMPTWREYVSLTPRDGSRYSMLVNKIVQWNQNPERQAKVRRWQTLRRVLDPHNPKASSTVHLFPQ